MKHLSIIITIMMLCLAFSGKAYAQRALPGMRGLEVRGGMVDGFFCEDHKNETGYYFGVALSRYSNNADKWIFGAEYLERNYPYKEGHIPVAQFTGEGGYFYKFLSDNRKTVFFSIGISAVAGYETVNWGDRLLFDGATIRNEDSFLYGGAISLEMEAYLTDRLILLLSGRERILWGTNTDRFHFQFGLGVRVIIN